MRRKNNNKNRGLTIDEKAFHIRLSIDGTRNIIKKCMKHYEETGDLAALKVAFDGYITLGEMLTKVRELYSYGNN
jgi:hypothetical protein